MSDEKSAGLPAVKLFEDEEVAAVAPCPLFVDEFVEPAVAAQIEAMLMFVYEVLISNTSG
ncbi:hypothetical protein C4H11_03995 [Bacteroides zoogleoformans]|uniref:Uncharacterized protein n=1 Tax=Bacteroides zoogleoformans TaxID=28119 RepID=A0ABM6T6F9_9BACE|nr:hypothetical protein C4H11_03995 [Bacteroides zoogleoformans]